MKRAVNKLVQIGFAVSLLMSVFPVSAQEVTPKVTTPAGPTTQQTQAAPTTSTTSTTSAPATGVTSSAEASEALPAGEAAAPTEPTAEAGALDGETYQVRLRDLEQRVDELKEQIRRSHTRLSLLSDTILAGSSGGGRAEIQFNNELSGAWHVVEAVFVLDGAVQYKKTDDTGVLAKQDTIPIFSGSVPTGDHTLQVMLKLRGHGFGVFSYLRGIEATVRSSHSFTLSDGKVLELKATAWEKGGPTTPVEQQPDVRFSSVVRSLSEMPKAAPAQSSSAATTSKTAGTPKAPEPQKLEATGGVDTTSSNKSGGTQLGTQSGAAAGSK